jgi:hypothetical protein
MPPPPPRLHRLRRTAHPRLHRPRRTAQPRLHPPSAHATLGFIAFGSRHPRLHCLRLTPPSASQPTPHGCKTSICFLRLFHVPLYRAPLLMTHRKHFRHRAGRTPSPRQTMQLRSPPRILTRPMSHPWNSPRGIRLQQAPLAMTHRKHPRSLLGQIITIA